AIRLAAGGRVRAHPAVDRLSGMGLGHRRRRTGALLLEALRLGDRAQRPHPSGDAEGGRQRHLPHRALDRISAAGARNGAVAGADEGAGRETAHDARHRQHHLQAERAAARHRRHAVEGLRREQDMTMRILTAMAAGAALLVSLAGPAGAAEVKVGIDNFTFNPKVVTVKAGDTVVWTNRDDIPHTVADPGKFKSKALDTGDTYSFTFTTPGSFDYFCSLHPHMTGRIVVETATGDTGAK